MKALYFDNNLAKIALQKATSKVHRWASLSPLSALSWKEIAEPRIPNPRWLKVRNIACGLCGTDVHFMFMEMDPKSFPAAVPGISRKFLGHELVAEVVEVGDDCEGLSVGDRVAMKVDWPSCLQLEIDPPCPQCARGRTLLCENVGTRRLPLQDVGGGFSRYMVMHRTQPFRIPDDLGTNHALLLEPTASAIHGILQAPPEPGQKVLVVGAGTIGLLTVAAMTHNYPNTEVYCLARHPFQQERAKKLGAHLLPPGNSVYKSVADITGSRYVKGALGNEIVLGGFDVVYDTVGSDRSLQDALRWTTGGGNVVLVGINFQPGKIDYTPVWTQEVILSGINCHAIESDGRHSFEHAAELLLEGAVDPDLILTHRMPMHRWKDAVKLFKNKKESEAVKIVLEQASKRFQSNPSTARRPERSQAT